MPLRGASQHISRLKRMASPATRAAVGRALFVGADTIKAEAQHLITQGSVSGKNHVPSAPGQPPNNDANGLKDNIEAVSKGPLLAEVSSNAEYAAALEFGTSRMEARPYMVPARDNKRDEVQGLVTQAINHAIRGGV